MLKIYDKNSSKKFTGLIFRRKCYYCGERFSEDDLIVSSGNNSNRKQYHWKCAELLNIV